MKTFTFVRTTKWYLHTSPTTFFYLVLQPSAATVCVAQVIKDTACLTIKTRRFNGHSLGSVEEDKPPTVHVLLSPLPSRSERRPTLPLHATHQPGTVLDSAIVCPKIPAEPHPDSQYSARWLGRGTRRLFLWHLLSSTTSWLCCIHLGDERWLLCSSPRTCGASSPVLLPRALVDGLANCVPVFVLKCWLPPAGVHFGGVDERALRNFVFSDGSVRRISRREKCAGWGFTAMKSY